MGQEPPLASKKSWVKQTKSPDSDRLSIQP
jgi:hypothetical protein